MFNPRVGHFSIDGNAADDAPHLVIGNTATTTLAGMLRVGYIGPGFLTMESGGVVTNTTGHISSASGSTAVATVTGTGSEWNKSRSLYVGENGGTGTLNVTGGGVVSNTTGYIGDDSGSTGVATVTGPGSQWNNSSNLYVGSSGTGTLNVADGGVVSNTYGFIGKSTGSTGVATVTGTGSEWNNSSDLHVGNSGDGILNIADDGVVTVGGATSIGTSGTAI